MGVNIYIYTNIHNKYISYQLSIVVKSKHQQGSCQNDINSCDIYSSPAILKIITEESSNEKHNH